MTNTVQQLITATVKFSFNKEIGQEGRNSKVWLAHDKQLDVELVVKAVKKSSFQNVLEYYKEVQTLAISEHSNVVQVRYACEDSDDIYFSMPFYKNGSIGSLLKKRHLTAREVIKYSFEFLSGLHNIHCKGLIHFDIKPDNIMISDSNQALLSDFGLAKATAANGFAEQDLAYTLHLPPEAFTQASHTLLYDIFQAGLTMYRMCNGVTHFDDQVSKITDLPKMILKGKFPDRRSYQIHMPSKLCRIINKMLQVDQDKRYQSVLDVLNDLSQIDDNLDWRYSATVKTNTWSLNKGNQMYKVQVEMDTPGTYMVKTTRTNTDTQRESKMNPFCCNNESLDNCIGLVKSALDKFG